MKDSTPGSCWDCWLPAFEPLEVPVLGPANIGAAAGFVKGAGPGRKCIILRPNGAMLQLMFCFATTIGFFLLEMAIVFAGDLQLSILFCRIDFCYNR